MENQAECHRIILSHLQISEGIIIEILSRLAVKSLLRFKCVSKSWSSLISSKYFIKNHIENSTTKNETIILVCSNSLGVLNPCCLYPLPTARSTHAFHLDYRMANPNYPGESLFVGSCNGLICVVNGVGSDQFSLWNLATRDFKQLPVFFTGFVDLKCSCVHSCGFGFDESSGDYKVFAFFYVVDSTYTSYIMANAYSLKADSWGEAKVYNYESLFHDPIDVVGKFASGKLHWIRNKVGTKSKWEIVCLDLNSETFGVVEKPSCVEDDFCPRLGVLDGCLCLFCDCLDRYDIWIWNKYGAEDSWTKLVNICYVSVSWNKSVLSIQLLSSSTPLCMLPNGEVLFTYGSIFVIYSPKDSGFRQGYIDKRLLVKWGSTLKV